MRKIEYLDLELSTYHSKNITLDRYNIDCNIEENFRQDTHTEISYLNNLVDLTINLSRNLKLEFDKFNKNLRHFR